jgi:hypothetical protein
MTHLRHRWEFEHKPRSPQRHLHSTKSSASRWNDPAEQYDEPFAPLNAFKRRVVMVVPHVITLASEQFKTLLLFAELATNVYARLFGFRGLDNPQLGVR